MKPPTLLVDGLSIAVVTPTGERRVAEDVSFHINEGEIVGLAGESGSGKSMVALSVMRLLPRNARCATGAISFRGQDIGKLTEDMLDRLRGHELSMIFQEPMTSLNPLLRSGFQIGEVLEVHAGLSRRAARAEAVKLMRAVGIPAPEERVDTYPHQLSGGMRQRVMIAIAIACAPKLLLADEPTTALDVSIQAQILGLIRRLRHERGMAVLFITHDLGVISALADRVVIVYAGEVVEEAGTRELFQAPRHPYTALLMRSMPRLRQRLDALPQIKGTPPVIASAIGGCRFHPRCPFALPRCQAERPALQTVAERRVARCWRVDEIEPRLREI